MARAASTASTCATASAGSARGSAIRWGSSSTTRRRLGRAQARPNTCGRRTDPCWVFAVARPNLRKSAHPRQLALVVVGVAVGEVDHGEALEVVAGLVLHGHA